MKKNTIVLFSLFAALSVSAQEVISTQGDSYTNSSASIDYTIGEVIINTGTDGTNDITQGFHQTNWNFVGLEDHAPNIEASVFPNPTEDILNIRTNAYENLSYSMYDGKGKLVLENAISSELTSIQVGHLAPGGYSLVLSNPTSTLKTFKLIKHTK